MKAFLLAAALLLVVVLLSESVSACPRYVLYKQCDSRWGSRHLGTSSQTICSAGCAMSDVSMILASEGIKINGAESNPGTLNSWLISHGGYVGGDLLVWNAIASLGNVSMLTYTTSVSQAELKKYVDSCHPVVVNVRGGSHWVLITASTGNLNVWQVNDPGFSQSTYDYSGMLRFVVYKVGKGETEPHQEQRAILADAATQ